MLKDEILEKIFAHEETTKISIGTQMVLANQQFQQMPVGISGKIVPNVESIAANDVPMDGSVAFSPKQDMSEVYAKSWNADGTIKTVVLQIFWRECKQ